jgi:hypothetical protein
MKTRSAATKATARPGTDTPVVELWREGTGVWRWRYLEDHAELLSNEDYATRRGAEKAARISYPGIPIIEGKRAVEPGSGKFWLLLAAGGLLLAFVLLAILGLVALVMMAVGWRGLRRRLRPLLRAWGRRFAQSPSLTFSH